MSYNEEIYITTCNCKASKRHSLFGSIGKWKMVDTNMHNNCNYCNYQPYHIRVSMFDYEVLKLGVDIYRRFYWVKNYE